MKKSIGTFFISTLFWACQVDQPLDLNTDTYDLALAIDENFVHTEVNHLTLMAEEIQAAYRPWGNEGGGEAIAMEPLGILRFTAEGSLIDPLRRTAAFSFCGTVTVQEDTKTVTLDFGNGCVGDYDARTRSGKVLIRYGGETVFSGERTIYFDRYVAAGQYFTGNFTLSIPNIIHTGYTLTRIADVAVYMTDLMSETDVSLLARKIPVHERDLAFSAIDTQLAVGTPFVFKGAHTFEYNHAGTVSDTYDDSFSVTGNTFGQTRENRSYQASVAGALVCKTACSEEGVYNPVSGRNAFSMGTMRFTVAYGRGATACNRQVEIVAGSLTARHTLRY